MSLISCEENDTRKHSEELSPLEKFISTYDGVEEIWYVYNNGDYQAQGNERSRVTEIITDNGKYHSYTDGIWNFSLNIVNEHDSIVYFNINSHSGMFTNDSTLFDLEGSNAYRGLDYPMYHGSFNGNTGKYQHCYRYYNLDPPWDFHILVFFEGYRSQ